MHECTFYSLFSWPLLFLESLCCCFVDTAFAKALDHFAHPALESIVYGKDNIRITTPSVLFFQVVCWGAPPEGENK